MHFFQKKRKKKPCLLLVFIEMNCVQGKRVAFEFWAHSTYFMGKYWTELGFHTEYSCFRKKEGIKCLWFLIPFSRKVPPSVESLNTFPVTLCHWKLANHWGVGFNWLIVHRPGMFTGIAEGRIPLLRSCCWREHLSSEANNWIDGRFLNDAWRKSLSYLNIHGSVACRGETGIQTWVQK